ncbi:noncompact myelin-associated protein [Clupea harengus]|uniref:Noncompact myelin-associated protein n=1 Tax=Clupea harengus TaxID=7950 RepID=A0A8M1KIL4_CLUHA|nr:noncompact myelin-associated protein [Clupea harengus]
MQTSTAQPVTNFTTVFLNTTSTTKSKEQILTQSSGAMIALIVIGIIIILIILLIILKTYNRRTHASRLLAGVGGSKPHKKSSSTTQVNMRMSHLAPSSVSGSFVLSSIPSENGFRLPRVDLANVDHNSLEQYSTASGSTVVSVHDAPSMENT